MDSTTDLVDNQTLNSTILVRGLKQQEASAGRTRRGTVLALWIMGFLLLVAAAVIERFHPAPWSFDLNSVLL